MCLLIGQFKFSVSSSEIMICLKKGTVETDKKDDRLMNPLTGNVLLNSLTGSFCILSWVLLSKLNGLALERSYSIMQEVKSETDMGNLRHRKSKSVCVCLS